MSGEGGSLIEHLIRLEVLASFPLTRALGHTSCKKTMVSKLSHVKLQRFLVISLPTVEKRRSGEDEVANPRHVCWRSWACVVREARELPEVRHSCRCRASCCARRMPECRRRRRPATITLETPYLSGAPYKVPQPRV